MAGRFHLLIIIFVIKLANSGWATELRTQSNWNKNLLSVELGEVSIKSEPLQTAWSEISGKYLLRANLYLDAEAYAIRTFFEFHLAKATGKDVFDAFVTTYPVFTYAQDPMTGVVWVYPKRVKFSDILDQKIKVAPGANEISMYSDVYIPLCKLLKSYVLDSDDSKVPFLGSRTIDPATGNPPIPTDWYYSVDLPAGVYSAREILDFCCAANPTKAFIIDQELGQNEPLVIHLKNLIYSNPFALPQAEAIKFWELELAASSNDVPSLEEVRMAMSDPDPRRRAAASLFVEACGNYVPNNLIGHAEGHDKTIWTALGVLSADYKGNWKDYFHFLMNDPKFCEDLKQVRNPDLALLASLQLTREDLDATYLDTIVTNHIYTVSDIASIKPELYRMARSSKAVREKLMAMKVQIPELSLAAINELTNANYLMLAPVETK